MNPANPIPRRTFLRHSAALAAGLALPQAVRAARPASPRSFTVAQRQGRWWFITPEGTPQFGLGLNHIDAAPLRYLASGDLWPRKYGNSMERWIREAVRPDVLAWGFNSVGWVQEVVTRGPTNHRHSPSFTYEEYQWLDLPQPGGAGTKSEGN